MKSQTAPLKSMAKCWLLTNEPKNSDKHTMTTTIENGYYTAKQIKEYTQLHKLNTPALALG